MTAVDVFWHLSSYLRDRGALCQALVDRAAERAKGRRLREAEVKGELAVSVARHCAKDFTWIFLR